MKKTKTLLNIQYECILEYCIIIRIEYQEKQHKTKGEWKTRNCTDVKNKKIERRKIIYNHKGSE